jgi:hypothetical protein
MKTYRIFFISSIGIESRRSSTYLESENRQQAIEKFRQQDDFTYLSKIISCRVVPKNTGRFI